MPGAEGIFLSFVLVFSPFSFESLMGQLRSAAQHNVMERLQSQLRGVLGDGGLQVVAASGSSKHRARRSCPPERLSPEVTPRSHRCVWLAGG